VTVPWFGSAFSFPFFPFPVCSALKAESGVAASVRVGLGVAGSLLRIEIGRSGAQDLAFVLEVFLILVWLFFLARPRKEKIAKVKGGDLGLE